VTLREGSLDAVAKRQALHLIGIEPQSSSSYPTHYTDRAVLAVTNVCKGEGEVLHVLH
jgi:hypothetical protein